MINGGSIVQKKSRDMKFSLFSPIDTSSNLGNSVFKAYDIFKIFKNRYYFIKNKKFNDNESVLKYLLNPMDKDF